MTPRQKTAVGLLVAIAVGVGLYLLFRPHHHRAHDQATCWAKDGYFVDHGHGRVIFWSGTGSPPSHVFRRHGRGDTPDVCGPLPR